jgi:hypothetical protein
VVSEVVAVVTIVELDEVSVGVVVMHEVVLLDISVILTVLCVQLAEVVVLV